ncbi:MAG: hypothetical protein HGA31_02125 [Candidatus Moranbacteria bacterium]|nr:hypothetical protein [Candidatus Moranbacteria bacterium]
MKKKWNINPQGPLSRFGDLLMLPLMYLVSGTFRESPQWTHQWNNVHILPEAFRNLDHEMAVETDPIPDALPGRTGVRFHIPVFGGWRDYVVLAPERETRWRIGWQTGPGGGASQIPLSGPVRMLRGPGPATFFGIDAKTGEQITIRIIGKGRIGDGGEFSKVKLL